MGRGRAKAKQAKVARELKYSSGGTDLDRLRAELGVGRDDAGRRTSPPTQTSRDRYSDSTTTTARTGRGRRVSVGS